MSEQTAFVHKPVLFAETIDSLQIKPDGFYVDGTAGGGGHSQAILQRLTTGHLLSIDQDPDAIAAVTARLAGFPGSIIRQGNFCSMAQIAADCGFTRADGILLDIGVSSYQLDTPQRGFSYHCDAPLDMRMSKDGPGAKELVNSLSWQALAKIISDYGEDKCAVRIAKAIVAAREQQPIQTTLQLAEIIKLAVPAAVRREAGHPARKTFQALRIAVNGELDRLQEGLENGFSLLRPGGVFSVITFHSLEDRIVKQKMNEWCTGCTCPPEFPVCVCGKKPRAQLLYKKGLAPSQQELMENPRARSARLRACIKCRDRCTDA